MKIHALIVLIGLLTACGDPIGAPCTLQSGALGFGFSDDCKGQCMALKDVICPDQSHVKKAVCSGAEGCTPGSCGQDQVCYTVDDPFDDESYCIPSDYCGATLSPEAAASWEKTSFDRAQAVHAAYAARVAKRTGKPTAPAAAVPTPPAATPPDPSKQAASILIASWGFDMAPVLCIAGDAVQTGPDCIQHLPAGTEVEHGGWRVKSTGRKTLECPAMKPVEGIGGEQVATAAGGNQTWAWVPAAPAAFVPAAVAPLDPALLEIARAVIPSVTDDMRIELAAAADLDGDPGIEKLVRVFTPSSDPEKPGLSELWWVDDATMTKLPTDGLELNGVQDVVGVLPLESGGAMVVFTSRWTGGFGVHVVGPTDGGLGAIAEVACGS